MSLLPTTIASLCSEVSACAERVIIGITVFAVHLASAFLRGVIAITVGSAATTLALPAPLLPMAIDMAELARVVLGMVSETATPLASASVAVRFQMTTPLALLALMVAKCVSNLSTPLADLSPTVLLQMSKTVAASADMLVVEMTELLAQGAELHGAEVPRMPDTLALAAHMLGLTVTTLLADAASGSLGAM